MITLGFDLFLGDDGFISFSKYIFMGIAFGFFLTLIMQGITHQEIRSEGIKSDDPLLLEKKPSKQIHSSMNLSSIKEHLGGFSMFSEIDLHENDSMISIQTSSDMISFSQKIKIALINTESDIYTYKISTQRKYLIPVIDYGQSYLKLCQLEKAITNTITTDHY